MKGRKPIPNALKKLAGDGMRDSGGRLIPGEPQAIQGPPPTPEELVGDSLLAWHSFLADTEGMRIITHADRAALIMLCQAWAEMQACQKMIDEQGTVILLPTNQPGLNPYCKARDNARGIVLKLLSEYGLTASSRSRIQIAPPENDDDDLFA